MRDRIKRISITVRLPLLVGTMIFVVAVGSTHIVLEGTARQFERNMQTLGSVYLDGISTALLPYTGKENASVAADVLRRALTIKSGVVDRTLILLDADGSVLARVDRNGTPQTRALPPEVATTLSGFYINEAKNNIWIWRSLPNFGSPEGTVVANLDITQFVRRREYLQWSLVAIDLFFSALCAILGIMIARRLQKPLSVLAEHLREAGVKGPQPIPESVLGNDDGDGARLLRAYNTMAAGAREREQMLARLADQEREAGLGRLAATIAHEVRNPLTGMLTAIKTVRKFGDQKEVRDEALDFLERGVSAMREVVNATLKTHRVLPGPRPLSVQDLRDLHLLVAAEAKRQGVTVGIENELPQTVPVNAAEVRQVLLNLLLNAVHASVPGGRVLLHGRLEAENLILEVLDSGDGMESEMVVGLETGMLPAHYDGLGIAVVVRLVKRLGGRISVQATAHSGAGTHIVVRIPLRV